MKEFYLERINTLEIQIGLAREGYLQKKVELGKALTFAKESEVDGIVKELVSINKAYNELKKDLESNQESYRKEVEKEGKING